MSAYSDGAISVVFASVSGVNRPSEQQIYCIVPWHDAGNAEQAQTYAAGERQQPISASIVLEAAAKQYRYSQLQKGRKT